MSVTVHTTDVVPTGNWAGALFVTPATPQLSDVTGMPRDMPEAVHLPASGDIPDRFAGHVIFGASVSFTVTVNIHVLTIPSASVEVYVTVVVPTVKVSPGL